VQNTRERRIQYICSHTQSRLLFLSVTRPWKGTWTDRPSAPNPTKSCTTWKLPRAHSTWSSGIWSPTRFSVYSLPVFPLSVSAGTYRDAATDSRPWRLWTQKHRFRLKSTRGRKCECTDLPSSRQTTGKSKWWRTELRLTHSR